MFKKYRIKEKHCTDQDKKTEDFRNFSGGTTIIIIIHRFCKIFMYLVQIVLMKIMFEE